MKKILVCLLLCCCGCLHDPYQPPDNFRQDSLWCYRKDRETGTWGVQGLARTCPAFTKEFP